MGRYNLLVPKCGQRSINCASKHYVKTGEFVMIKIIDATEFDLTTEPV
jgi:ribosomal protein S12 methylthiotransferase